MESSAVIPALYEALSDESEAVRAEAHHSLVEMGESGEEVASLRRQATLAFLSNPSASIRCEAAKGLLRTGKTEDVDDLVKALRDPDKEIRWWAARALGRIGAPSAIPDLQAAVADTSWRVRDSAALSLADLGDRSVIPDLKRLYKRYPTVNGWITDRLRKLGVTEDEIARAKADAKNRKR